MAKKRERITETDMKCYALSKMVLMFGFCGGLGGLLGYLLNPLQRGVLIMPTLCGILVVLSAPVYLVMVRRLGFW